LLIGELRVEFLTTFVDRHSLVLFDGQLLDVTRVDSSHEGHQIDFGGIFTGGVYQLIKQQRAGNN
jgi:hypothetical protein